MSTTPGSSPCSRTLSCPVFSAASCEVFTGDSTTHVEFAGAARGQLPYGQRCKTGLSSEWFPFLQWPLTLSSDGPKRFLSQGTLTTWISCSLSQCAYADDLAVASFSFRGLMTALHHQRFNLWISLLALNLNYRKCCWVQYGTEGRESLRQWISENCEEFREVQIVRHDKYVGTMICPGGHIHRWSASRNFHPARAEKSMHLPRAWLSDCVTSRIMRFLC